MSDIPDNLVLEREAPRCAARSARIQRTRVPVGMLEAGYASISLRLAGDIKRIKRRLDLVEMP
jgi:hypothetical protein